MTKPTTIGAVMAIQSVGCDYLLKCSSHSGEPISVTREGEVRLPSRVQAPTVQLNMLLWTSCPIIHYSTLKVECLDENHFAWMLQPEWHLHK